MAKVDLNAAIGGLRGKVDGWVYRQQNGQTVVMPHRSSGKKQPSSAQQGGRERFRAAQAYAAGVLSDPLRRAVYQKLGAERKRPPNALLISNFLTPPIIERIELADYDGRAGHEIKIVASDAIEVIDVTINVRRADRALVESGHAVKDHGVWIYCTTTALAPDMPWHVEVTAQPCSRRSDRDGFKELRQGLPAEHRKTRTPVNIEQEHAERHRICLYFCVRDVAILMRPGTGA